MDFRRRPDEAPRILSPKPGFWRHKKSRPAETSKEDRTSSGVCMKKLKTPACCLPLENLGRHSIMVDMMVYGLFALAWMVLKQVFERVFSEPSSQCYRSHVFFCFLQKSGVHFCTSIAVRVCVCGGHSRFWPSTLYPPGNQNQTPPKPQRTTKEHKIHQNPFPFDRLQSGCRQKVLFVNSHPFDFGL